MLVLRKKDQRWNYQIDVFRWKCFPAHLRTHRSLVAFLATDVTFEGF